MLHRKKDETIKQHCAREYEHIPVMKDLEPVTEVPQLANLEDMTPEQRLDAITQRWSEELSEPRAKARMQQYYPRLYKPVLDEIIVIIPSQPEPVVGSFI